MNKLLTTSALCLGLTAGAVSAQGVPTIDISSIVQLQQMVAEAQLQLCGRCKTGDERSLIPGIISGVLLFLRGHKDWIPAQVGTADYWGI